MSSRAPRLSAVGLLAVLSLLGWGHYLVLAKEAPEPAVQTDLSPKHPDFKEFRIIVERNVFDSTRKHDAAKFGSETASSTSEAASPASTVRRDDVIVLDGTVIRGDEAWALFDGAPDVPPEGVKMGGTVAGYHVDEVRIGTVTLSNEQGTVQLAVGAGLAKNENGAWIPVDNPVLEAPPDAASKAGEGAKDPNDPAEKLRERRRKELGL